MSRIPLAVRVFVARRAHHRCEYCRSSEECTGQAFTVDHILAEALGGTDSPDNLGWCCFWCNAFKQARREARDPISGEIVALYHPRLDRWTDHFRWSRGALTILGRTPTGRATIDALRLNRPTLVRARRAWGKQAKHPR